MLQKMLHPDLPLHSIDPLFNTQYDESLHGTKLACELNIQGIVSDLIQRYLPVFDKRGVIHPVKSYE